MTERNDLSKNHYEVLGLDQDASAAEIKASYKKLLLLSHPDKQIQKNGSASSAELFLEIEEAWSILSDPFKKKEYDAQLKVTELDQSAPVQIKLKKTEMCFSEETATYTMDCRCGGEYSISEEQISEGYDFIPCNTCTLLGQLVP